MFPSSGLFADINCPFVQRGQCERPHCLYKHGLEARDTFGASYKSPIVDFAGIKNGYPYATYGAPVNDGAKDDCLHELERINKEIETVRHEVEQEQRRLSRCQTVQADSKNSAPVSKCETTGKYVDRGFYELPSCTDFLKTHARAKKYVVDNSKPRTDLEYDPLSNFSADLRSFGSSGKEQKGKNRQGLKRARNAVACDQKEVATYQAQLSRSLSPEPLNSKEDHVLIIDVPPSPDKTRGQGQKPVDSATVKAFQDTTEEVKEVTTVPILCDSPPLNFANTEAFKVTSPSASRVKTNKVYNCPSTFNDDKECENMAVDMSIANITECIEDLERQCQKITGFQSTETIVEKTPDTSDQQDHSWNNPLCAEKINPLQPPKDSPVVTVPPASSPRRQHTKQAQTTEQPDQDRVNSFWSPEQSVPSLVPDSQKMASKIPGEMQSKANHTSPVRNQEHAGLASSNSPFPAQYVLSTSVNSQLTVESSLEATEELFVKGDHKEVIIIGSSSDEEEEEEFNHSEMELSDSDPMEECYRIFMEANNEDKRNEEHPDVTIGAMNVEKPEVNVSPQAVPGKKRVAHEAKHMEQPAAKSRPQPQVLVPFRGPVVSGSWPSITSKMLQVQQRPSMQSSSVKAGQAFSSTCQKKPETQSTPSALTQAPKNLQPVPVQNAYLSYIPMGTAVIEVGDNLHLILPDSAFPLPVTSSSSPVTSVLTPISQVQTSTFTVKQTCHPPANPVQRYRSTAPVLIPALARKPSLSSAFASTSVQLNPAASATSQAAAQAAAKPMPAKRKLKQRYEAPKDKVPQDVRQRYVNLFTEEFLKTSANVNDAFEKALEEERTVYNRSVNKLKYLSVAVNALKKLKNKNGAAAAKNENEVNSQSLKGNIPLDPKKFNANDDMALYESLKDYILTDERLIESNYPVQHPEKPGCAVLFVDNKKVNTDPLKRICCRCGATYSVSQTGKHIRKEECNYHYGKGVEKRVPGGVETRYSCCEGVMGAPGCQVFKLHVHDSLGLDGFLSTIPRCPSDTRCPGVYSLDCEMCYTVHGLELSRVTVVNSSLQVVYDSFVRPDNEVIDYNTRFSGISQADVKSNNSSLCKVQETLLSFISTDTILIGHGLETDLCLLKLLHGTVVDTSVAFPHRLGPPHKLALNNLTAEYLRRIIQESVCGHDTAEDAAACMELMLWKVKEDGKLKK